MPSLDHHVLMSLQLDRWSPDYPLRHYDIERELAEQQTLRPVKPRRKFRLSPFWRRIEA